MMKYKYILPLIITAVITFIGASAAYAQVSNLTIGGGSDAASLSLGVGCTLTAGDITINGTLESTSNTSPFATIYVRRGWDSTNGTFNALRSNVQFIESLIGPGTEATLKGSNTFYNLIVEPTGPGTEGRPMFFEAGTTQVIDKDLILRGRSETARLELMSDTPGVRAFIKLASLSSGGTQDIAFVEVSDHEADAAGQHLSPGPAFETGSLDSGNIDRWFTIADPVLDLDNDGLADLDEIDYNTDPNNDDTDGDGIVDGTEVYTSGTDPLNDDTDYDGIVDGTEVYTSGTDPLNWDSDGNGVSDGFDDLGVVSIFTVSKAVDTNDGVCDRDCSLREAIIASNAFADADIIYIPSDTIGTETISLSLGEANEDLAANGDLDILNPVAIVGTGISLATIIDGTAMSGGGGADRIFHIKNGSTVELNSIGIQGGIVAGDGGGVLNDDGSMRITNCTVSNNIATGSRGGGINNKSNMTVINSTVDGNTAGYGGGITNYSSANMIIVNSTIRNNTASSANGGGIENNFGTSLTITDSTIKDNNAPNGSGVFNHNQTPNTVTISNSSITNNGTLAGATNGCGIYTNGSDGSIVNITNTTISNNGYSNANSGGMYAYNSIVHITNATIVNNTAGYASGIRAESNSTVTLRNSILSANTASTVGPNCIGTLVSYNNNMIDDTTDCTITEQSGDLFDGNVTTPVLGVTLGAFIDPEVPGMGRFPLIDGGQAVEVYNDIAAPVVDQLDLPRPGDSNGDFIVFDDIGAIEFYPICTNYIDVVGVVTNYDPTPIPEFPFGVFTFTLNYQNNGSFDIANPYFEVVIFDCLTPGCGNMLLNANRDMGGIGAIVTADVGRDLVLTKSPQEQATLAFNIGLKSNGRFQFYIHLKGEFYP